MRSDILVAHERLPDEVAAWPAVPLELAQGVLLTRAKVDGRALRLLVDTGTDELLLLTDAPGAGKVASTHDVFANPIELVWGSAELEWERGPRKVGAWRTRSHPAFERHARQIGGADGILGIATLGNRRLVFDVANAKLHIEPSSGSPR